MKSSTTSSRKAIVLSFTILIVLLLSDSTSAVFYFEWPSFIFFKKPFVLPPTTPRPALESAGAYGPPYAPSFALAQALVAERFGDDDKAEWCTTEARQSLGLSCSCRGPSKFPIIRCTNITGQQKVSNLLDTKFSFKSFGRLLVTNSSIPVVERYPLTADKEFAVISFVKTETTSFDLSTLESSQNSLVRLEITHNLLTTFAFSNLTKFKYLSHLDLRYNDFKTIPDDAFGHNDQLRSIDLSHNKISYVGSNAFHSLPRLQDLDMSFNKLKVINNYAFASLSPPSRVLTLDLSNNKIFFLANDSFTGLAPKELILEKNAMNKFPERHFKPMLKYIVTQPDAFISVEGTSQEKPFRDITLQSTHFYFNPLFTSSFSIISR